MTKYEEIEAIFQAQFNLLETQQKLLKDPYTNIERVKISAMMNTTGVLITIGRLLNTKFNGVE